MKKLEFTIFNKNYLKKKLSKNHVLFSELLVMFEGYRKLLENTANVEEQLNNTEAIERAPKVYDQLKKLHKHFQCLLRRANIGKH